MRYSGFSQRLGKVRVREAFQTDSMDSDLRTALWNCCQRRYFGHCDQNTVEICRFFHKLWDEFLGRPINDVSQYIGANINETKKWFFERAQWNEVYDFVEFLLAVKSPGGDKATSLFPRDCQEQLVKEKSGYRIAGHKIVPITDENELAAIEEASHSKRRDGFEPARGHIEKALAFLADRKNPDYANSIKESISGVESAAKIIAGNDKATLSDCLKELKGILSLHPAFIKGVSALYGCTSDAAGIRHAATTIANPPFEEAKYMLAICASMVNFLIARKAAVAADAR